MTKIFPGWPLALAAPLSLGMGPMQIDVAKVPKSTMVSGVAKAPLDVPFESLLGTLCEYDVGGDMSADDPVIYQVAVEASLADRLVADKPKDKDDVETMGRDAKRTAIACPGGENFVLAILDLPWPLSDAWQVSRFRTSVSDTEARIYFDFLGGTAKQSSGYWNIRKLDDATTELTNKFDFDVGFRIPEFLIKWGVNSALPKFFKDIERFSQTWQPSRPAETQAQIVAQ
jgi:hypothetical protein